MQLAGLGEIKTIELIKSVTSKKSKFIKVGIGDDACVLKDGTIITTDAYMQDVHFSLDYFNLFEIGERVVCGTLSDIAAMAAKPIALFVSALLPPNLEQKNLKDLYKGMLSISNKFACEIAGGDIVAYPKLGFILTAIGKSDNAKLRSSAKPGDHLYITGYCGLSETGRLALKNKLSKREFNQSIQRHTCPEPRIKEALKLKKQINALIDTSDGLSTDTFHIAQESNKKIKILYDALPIHPETKRLALRLNISEKDLILNSGEDYELLFTSKYKNLPSNISGTRITRIGTVEKGSGVILIDNNRLVNILPKGYDHFRNNDIE